MRPTSSVSSSTPGPFFEALEPRVLFAVDPVTQDNPVWFIPRGSAVVDGVLNDADWDAAFTITRTQPTRPDSLAVIRMMYTDAGVFLSADVQDQNIWADGMGGTSGQRWEVESDDSITFYFDPDRSADEYFQPGDRAFGVNLASMLDAVNGGGSSAARRWKFINGNGAGGGADVIPGGDIPVGTVYASSVRGTINNPSDIDQGWSIEMFLPWEVLGISGASHGTTIGMNFDMIQDNDGGVRNLIDNRSNPDPNVRYLQPHFIDDHIQGSHSSYTGTQAGIRGPVNYAQAMFIDSRAGMRPAAVSDLSVFNVGSRGATLAFSSPAGTTTGLGNVDRYEIRYSTTPITSDAQWLAATEAINAYAPRLAGLPEQLRIAELTPSTTYFVAVRSIDFAGSYSDLSNLGTFTTLASSPGDRGRIIPAPSGNMLMYENGDPFIVVGDHLGLSWGYTRQLFPGRIWDDINQIYQNFSTHIPYEGEYGPYFDSLAASGVNTMRLYLELQNVYYEGNPNPPDGMYWLESAPGQYNDEMRQFIVNVLREASARGIKMIFSPFDTYSYDEAFGNEGPWSTNFGGPLTSIDDFFQTPQTLAISKHRMQTLIGWVAQSGYADSLLGWEPVSEWDSYEWTLNAEGNGEPGRETEMRRRAQWVDDLALFIKQRDPNHLVFNSTIVRDPRGPQAREVFYSRTFDALTPHLYSNANEGPYYNPQQDKSVLAAIESGYLTSYWMTHRIDNRAILNGEWGMTRVAWPNNRPEYSSAFTQQQDEDLYRTMIWSSFASGQFGTALRINTEELDWNYYLLTPAMRTSQRTFSNFVNSGSLGLDFGHFTLRSLAGQITASAPGRSLLSWGVSDGAQGVAYILQNGNVSTGTVTNGVLTISGLDLNRLFDIEVWSTAAGVTAPLATIPGIFVSTGDLSINLPAFGRDVAIKFKARPVQAQSQQIVSIDAAGSIVTFSLGLDGQPVAHIVDSATGLVTIQDVAALSNFRGRVVDMTPMKTADGLIRLAITDDRSHMWFLTGDIKAGAWNAVDLTALIGAPGVSGDLTSYLPSWGSIHVAALDARGHAINYWYAPEWGTWQFTDLTQSFDGPVLTGGLTGFVTGWDGLNLAGLNDQGEIIVYWWAPGIEQFNGGNPYQWLVQNMTAVLDGPRFVGQLDAFVTAWGGLNVVGLTADGDVWSYWWSPQLKADNEAAGRPNLWAISNLTEASGSTQAMAKGVEVGVSADGGINVFAIDPSDNLTMFRWIPGSVWRSTNVTAATGAPKAGLPLGSAAAGNRLVVASRAKDGTSRLTLSMLTLSVDQWFSQEYSLAFAA
ncbi:MAG: hypothetical protein KF745_11165 [Phycisphaeraceae bacterium]|nr:hypothetical protein [Phycisphaeraceae bacterium]